MRPQLHECSQHFWVCVRVACSHLFSSLLHSHFRSCLTNIFTVFRAHALLRSTGFWILRWTVTPEFVCRNHSQFEFSALILVAATIFERLHTLLTKKKILTNDDDVTNTYIEMCTFSLEYFLYRVLSLSCAFSIMYFLYRVLSLLCTFPIVHFLYRVSAQRKLTKMDWNTLSILRRAKSSSRLIHDLPL